MFEDEFGCFYGSLEQPLLHGRSRPCASRFFTFNLCMKRLPMPAEGAVLFLLLRTAVSGVCASCVSDCISNVTAATATDAARRWLELCHAGTRECEGTHVPPYLCCCPLTRLVQWSGEAVSVACGGLSAQRPSGAAEAPCSPAVPDAHRSSRL